ncbi:N-terminal kinase-like protein [Neodiprion pinetum]|uniref:N-terminal kinase-like protein n=1 Tax=Neodiprion lecontei TaxID=441921 RepID=A0A6J0BV27_NEOLC|nr:N-terminal kinase-like protein [Neodiprion lecontei]XP_046492020.1 N-terminal kinase-like protein [Neodiprion pinetum]
MWSFFSRDPTKDFPYEIGEPVFGFEGKSLWTLHRAKRKGTNVGEDVSVFVIQAKNGGDADLETARAAVKRLKTLRHPSILTYLDNLETEKTIYLATERVEPLQLRLHGNNLPEGQQRDLYLSWGIFQITRALSFLNNDGNLRHNNINLWSVFVNVESGEWKLGGVEYTTGVTVNYTPLPAALRVYQPPEATETYKPQSKCTIDAWGLGCLIWEAFNGPLNRSADLKTKTNQIPKQLLAVYRELSSHNADVRPNPADVIARCRSNGGYFKNDLVDALLFLEEIQMKEKGEKSRFFTQLASKLESFPDGVGRYKILPQLLAAFDFGDAGSAVLPPLLQLGRKLPDPEYQRRVVPCVVKLFASNDRATRLRLLQHLERFVNHLQPSTVNEAIFPQVARGFLDTNPAVREHTIKSVVHLASKLDYNNLNVETLRHFARLQSKDDQGGIRTNTTVCLGKIAQHLHPQIRQKVLIGAFVRGTRDSFAPARSASILALAATQQYFLLQEVANRILPALCPLATDVDKGVRENAFRTIRGFLSKLERVSEDPGLRESMEADVNTATPSLSNAAATWAGWAVTAVTAKFYRSQSDTPKSSNTQASRILLSKPASLEQASSSQSSASTTTTTSSATSMTSLDHDQDQDPQSTGNTNSDCEWDCWEADNWGDMEQQSVTTPNVAASMAKTQSSAVASKVHDPQWENLEEEPEEESQADDKGGYDGSRQEGWDDSEFQPIEEFPSFEQSASNAKLEEAKKKREERKLARQRQMEAKRAARIQGNSAPKKI